MAKFQPPSPPNFKKTQPPLPPPPSPPHTHSSPHTTKVFHARLYGRFIEIKSNFKRTKLHKVNEDSNLSRGSLSNRDNIRVPIQFKGKRHYQNLKKWLFFKNRPIQFQINTTRVITPVKWSIFLSIEKNKNKNKLLHRQHHQESH